MTGEDRPHSGLEPLRPGALVLPLGVGTAVRLVLVAAFFGTQGLGDEAAYLNLAAEWRETGAYTGMWAPLYPKVLSWLMGPFGTGAGDAMRFLQVVMALWVGATTAYTAALFGGRRAGVAAAWVFALYLPLAGFTALHYSEHLFLSFFAPALYQLLRIAKEPGRSTLGRAALAGVLFGLACLTRESTLIFLPPLMLWMAWTLRRSEARGPLGGLGSALGPALGLGLCAGLTILPWTIRNYGVHDRFVPIATSSHGSSAIGLNAHDINYDLAGLGPSILEPPGELRRKIRGKAPEPWTPRPAENPADASGQNIRDGFAFAAANPVFFLRSRVVEVCDLLSPLSFPVRSLRTTDGIGAPLSATWPRRIFAGSSVAMVPLLLLLALLGWAAGRNLGPLGSLCSLVMLMTVSVAVINGLTRYRVPALPLLMVLAGIALSGRLERPTGARRAVALAAALGLVALWIPSWEPTRAALAAIWSPR